MAHMAHDPETTPNGSNIKTEYWWLVLGLNSSFWIRSQYSGYSGYSGIFQTGIRCCPFLLVGVGLGCGASLRVLVRLGLAL